MDRRRFLLTSLAGALPAPLLARAQQVAKIHRVAVVTAAGSVAEMTEDSFFRGSIAEMRRLGYTEGQNLVVERWSGGRRENYPDVAQRVVRSRPDVIFTGSGRLAQAFRAVTSSIPIVTMTGDPLALGLATSLARPGGNVTGFSIAGPDVLGKRLELLKKAVPTASRIAYLAPRVVWENRWGQIMRESGARTGVIVVGALLDNPIEEPEYRRAFAAMATARSDALVVSDHAEGIAHRRLIVALAAQARRPTIYAFRVFVEAGGLMAYAADELAISRGSAGYIDRILKGATPGELPFQEPTKFELVINLKTAKALGLTIPPSLLGRADEVIACPEKGRCD